MELSKRPFKPFQRSILAGIDDSCRVAGSIRESKRQITPHHLYKKKIKLAWVEWGRSRYGIVCSLEKSIITHGDSQCSSEAQV